MSTTIMQSLTFMILIVSDKITTLKFLPHRDTWPADLRVIITQAHIFNVSKKNNNKKKEEKEINIFYIFYRLFRWLVF